ncbi:hypothetical protein GCM10009557_07640 [Virgisporangium ochraceum]|uniref:Uncharacterized protein n=1 Tax=Virgisporangium ochraceum TaxID=65505 RepID=A0A8J4A278_9ACTN|nr:hypothetical protein Voc01_094060 [Virgisporangium ochraceum]
MSDESVIDVRQLLNQETVAVGWSDPGIAARVSAMLESWFMVPTQVATEAEECFGSHRPDAPVRHRRPHRAVGPRRPTLL